MRILSIKLKNINSLRGEHLVDFDASPLREAGLFGIVGATGAGKSTILDCITLALYGRVPRVGQVTKTVLDKGGVILTKHEKECYAEVTYVCRNGRFKASWSVSKTRNNTFRDVEMKVENDAGELLTEKLSSAPEVNIRNIGLDYDQFVKSILLCQGEFAKFLQSDKNKRAELLEKITGTRQFRKIGKKAYKEFIRRSKLVEERSLLIEELNKSLLSAEDRALLLAGIQDSTEKINGIEQQLDEAKARLARADRMRKLNKERLAQEKKKTETQHQLKAFEEEHGAALAHYDKLFVYKEQLSDHGRLTSALAEGEKKINGYDALIAQCDAEIDRMVLELRQWVAEEVSVDDYVQHLRAFRDKVRDARKKRDEQKRLLKAGYERLMPLLALPAFEPERALFKPSASNEQLLIKLRGRKHNEASAYASAKALYGFRDEEMETLRSAINDMIRDLGELKLEVRSYKLHIDHLKQVGKKITEGEGELALFDLQALRLALDEALNVYEKAEQERNELLRAEKLDELRKSLKDGEPCPLCGSAHHPYLHGFAEDVLKSVDALTGAKDRLDQCRKQYDAAATRVAELTAALDSDKQLRDSLENEKKRIFQLVESYKVKLGIDKVQQEDKVQELIEEQKKRLSALEACIRFRQWEPQVMQVEQELEAYDSLLAGLGRIEDELKEMYTGQDLEADCAQREATLMGLQQKRRVAQEQRRTTAEQLRHDEMLLKDLVAALQRDLTRLGYKGIDEALALLIPEGEQKKLAARKALLGQDLHGSTQMLALLDEQLKNENVDGDDTDPEQQQLKVNALDAELKQLREGLKEQNARLYSDDERLKQAASYGEERKSLQDALRPWEMLNKLIGDATGNKFNNMAQELTLGHLLILANQRLGRLHSRYKILAPADDDDLRVEDSFMGNEVRTVRSLSGGETFVLSLAMALGLSDLASRDIRIDSLFIDEGFGSLDPETLEEAMSTLEQLQSESNKTVGIISHVDSLKERIYTQIRLSKSNNGFSTLSIFPETGDADEAE